MNVRPADLVDSAPVDSGNSAFVLTVRLPELEIGRCATIAVIHAPVGDLNRLAGMGVCAGREVQVVKHGDPMIIRACGARLGLAMPLAQLIDVHPCTNSCDCPSTARGSGVA